MAARAHDRTNATTDPTLAFERTKNLKPADYPFLERAGSHLSALLDLDQAQGMQAAVALSPRMAEEQRTEFLTRVVGETHSSNCRALLKHVEGVMNEEHRGHLNTEIAVALGEIY